MDISKLAGDLIGILKAAAPLVGMGEEVAAAEALLESATSAYETIKDTLGSDDQAEMQEALNVLAARVNDHADRTAGSLG